jgi:hypothetical protein
MVSFIVEPDKCTNTKTFSYTVLFITPTFFSHSCDHLQGVVQWSQKWPKNVGVINKTAELNIFAIVHLLVCTRKYVQLKAWYRIHKQSSCSSFYFVLFKYIHYYFNVIMNHFMQQTACASGGRKILGYTTKCKPTAGVQCYHRPNNMD